MGDALLAYNTGNTPDFLLVALHGGVLRVSVNDGSGETSQSWDGKRLDDADWHLFELRQNGQKQFNISVDDLEPVTLDVISQDDFHNVFELFSPLYVGGLPSRLLQSPFHHGLANWTSVSGFVGCLATLTINGLLHDPTTALPSSAVTGCRSQSVLPSRSLYLKQWLDYLYSFVIE